MSPTPAATPYPQLMLFGDSITEFSASSPSPFSFISSLSWQYSRRLDVVNRGLSGFNTAHALYALPRFFPPPPSSSSATAPSPRVQLLVVFFGANDSSPPANTGQHVPLDQYAANLTSIIKHPVVRAHDPAIIVVTPPPVDERMFAESALGEGARIASVTAAYARAAREVAASAAAQQQQQQTGGSKSKIACCDLWTAFMQEATREPSSTDAGHDYTGKAPDVAAAAAAAAAGFEEPYPGDARAPVNKALQALLTDGLHFTSDAYHVWHRELLKTIELNFYPELDPAQMEMVFPHWTQMPKA